MTSDECEHITLPAQSLESGGQEAIARLQRQCFEELGTVQQFHGWLDDKRQCRQASLCDRGLPYRKNDCL